MEKRAMDLQPYYVYDPHIGDELGGIRVQRGDKGAFILANRQMAQYWIDQGLMGDKPVNELSEKAKSLLAQFTRGRSKDPDTAPKRVPKYNKAMHSGAMAYAGRSGLPERSHLQRQQELIKRRKANETAKSATKPATPKSAATK